MNYAPVLKKFCQFAVESSGLFDIVTVSLDSDFVILASDTRTQNIAFTDEGCRILDNGEFLGIRLNPVDLADVAAFVVARHVKDVLLQAINEEYKK